MAVKYNAWTVAVVALLSAAGSVQAADLIVEEPGVVAAAGFDWSGFYAGVNAGIASGTFEHPLSLPFGGGEVPTTADGSLDITAGGFVGGVQAGYNAQLDNNILLGIEADLSGSTVDGRVSADISIPDGPAEVSFDAGTKLDWLATIRPRLGYVNDNFVVYGTAGVAFGHSTSSVNFNLGGEPGTTEIENDRFGWVVGAGVEFALADNVTLKTEYTYTDLGTENLFSSEFGEGASLSLDSRIAFHTLKVGVNFHF